MNAFIWVAIGLATAAVVAVVAAAVGTWRTRSNAGQRLSAISTRLGGIAEDLRELQGGASTSESLPDLPASRREGSLETILSDLDRATGGAVAAVSSYFDEVRRLRAALDALPQGVVIRDDQGEVSFRNARATSLIGSRHSDLLAARAVEEQLDATSPHQASDRTIELYGPPRRTLVVHTTPIDDGRRALGVAAVLEDVSERRRLESIRRDFVANVSHELKTPVAALGLLAETLLSEKDPEVTQRLATRIQTESFRVSRIIDDLLDLSRIEAEEAPPREPVSLHLVLAEATEQLKETARKRSVTIQLVEPDHSAVVVGDRRQLVSAVHNLLENAIKYSEDGSNVLLEANAGGGVVDVVVTDHGIGIPARDLERIFERFYRVDQGRSRATGGTGLGLAIVRHVASNHGGEVLVESREGEGSRFTLRLPAHSSQIVETTS